MQEITEYQFWCAIYILLNNYHALNKSIFECLVKRVERVCKGIELLYGTSTDTASIHLSNAALKDLKRELYAPTPHVRCEGFRIQLRLLSKKLEKYSIDGCIIIDFINSKYISRLTNDLIGEFIISYANGQVQINSLNQFNSRTRGWIEHVLKSKFLKWCETAEVSSNMSPVLKSLQLLDIEQYNDLYKALKQRYATYLKQLWQSAGESTDPLKFIYEDLAIAAYLICLWRCNNCKPNAFADLGCGNGLLVYILNAEGYIGYGYDLRARKLWSLYNGNTVLREQYIVPDKLTLPVNVDWLIGNHSDELSPWLPVLAATAGYNVNYFLLPCCAYEFSGAKFRRRNARISAYRDFLQYAMVISRKCGFVTLQDRLKIPSTRRIALVGLGRTYAKANHDESCQTLRMFVRTERENYPVNGQVIDYIKLREKAEVVRNCTQLDKQFVHTLTLKVFNMLLEDNDTMVNSWSRGKRLHIREVAQNLTKDELKQIKSECGGIKTLLRNQHEIFKFFVDGQIGIRIPMKRSFSNPNEEKLKKRLCFFKEYHPNGCPLTETECSFLH